MARPIGPRGQTRERVLEVAVELFAVHGVGATSLQQIADRLGVTKAAVYHLYPSKDDIVLAVLRPVLDGLGEVAARAAAQPTRRSQVQTALFALVDLVVANRAVMAVLQGDPAVAAVLQDHPPLQERSEQLTALVIGTRPSAELRVALAVFGAGLTMSAADPLLVALSERELVRELRACVQRLVLSLLPPDGADDGPADPAVTGEGCSSVTAPAVPARAPGRAIEEES